MKRMLVVSLACVFVTLPLMACAATPEPANLGDQAATTAANVAATAEAAAAKEAAQAALTPLLTTLQGVLPAWKTATDTAVADAQAAADELAVDPTLITDAGWIEKVGLAVAALRKSGTDAQAQADGLGDAIEAAPVKLGLATMATDIGAMAGQFDTALTSGDAAAMALAAGGLAALKDSIATSTADLDVTLMALVGPLAGAAAVSVAGEDKVLVFFKAWKTDLGMALTDLQKLAADLNTTPTLITDATWLADMNAKLALVRTAAANAVAQADTLDATTDAAAKEALGTLATGLTGLADNLDAALTAGDAAAVGVAIAAIDGLNQNLVDFEGTLVPPDATAVQPATP